MINSDLCSSIENGKKRRQYIHKKKLEMMIFYRDSLERRISALDASINTLEQQIGRDSELED